MRRTCSGNWTVSRRLGAAYLGRRPCALVAGLIGLLVGLVPGPALAQRTVQITSRDGFPLRAAYYAPAQPGPGILLLHQCNRRGPLTGYETLAGALMEAGFHVLMLDSRGFGESRDDRYRDYHTQMALIEPKVDDDVAAAYQFLVAQARVTAHAVGAVGASCGMRQAVRLAQHHEAVRALVFLSGAYESEARRRADYAALADRPVLAVYSEDDRYNTPATMRAVFDQAEHPASRLLAYKGTAHGTPLFDQDPGLVATLVRWFVTHLADE